MPPSLLSDAALVTRGRPAPSRASDLRTDAMLLTRGREGSESLLAAALLLDAVRSGHLDILEGRRVIAGRHTAASHHSSPTSAPASSRPPRAPR
jgi:hypothetical protein